MGIDTERFTIEETPEILAQMVGLASTLNLKIEEAFHLGQIGTRESATMFHVKHREQSHERCTEPSDGATARNA